MFNQGYNKKRLFILIGLVATILLFIVVASVVAYFTSLKNPYGESVKIQNYSQIVKNLSPDIRESIEASLYNTVKKNMATVPSIKDALIRKDTATQKEVKKNTQFTGSFIVDIASIRQSYQVGYSYSTNPDDGFMTGYPITITCVNPNDAIYSEFTCQSTLSHEADQTDPVLTLLPHSTLNYAITAFTDLDNNKKITLTVTLLLTEADRRTDPVAAAAQYQAEAQSWLNSQGLDLSKYTINYVTN